MLTFGFGFVCFELVVLLFVFLVCGFVLFTYVSLVCVSMFSRVLTWLGVVDFVDFGFWSSTMRVIFGWCWYLFHVALGLDLDVLCFVVYLLFGCLWWRWFEVLLTVYWLLVLIVFVLVWCFDCGLGLLFWLML